ncbi:MAG TPA: PA2779 family protein [Longimicrobiales bacterium]
MVRSFVAALALGAALSFAAPAAAQQADQMGPAQAEWTAADEDRSTVLRFLEREDVAGAAERMGYGQQELGRAALELSDADAARVADELRAAEQAFAADTITFTTTTLIIILLVVILLVLVVD